MPCLTAPALRRLQYFPHSQESQQYAVSRKHLRLAAHARTKRALQPVECTHSGRYWRPASHPKLTSTAPHTLHIRTAQHVFLPSARHDVTLIGLDGFEALEQEQRNPKAYRDPASLLVSENFGLDGYRAKNRSHDRIQAMGKTGNRSGLCPLSCTGPWSESLRD